MVIRLVTFGWLLKKIKKYLTNTKFSNIIKSTKGKENKKNDYSNDSLLHNADSVYSTDSFIHNNDGYGF